jgi:hypothetical protein
MSNKLNEAELLAKFKSTIDDYGRNIVFYQSDGVTPYTAIKITPPRRLLEMDDDNIPVETKVGIISASGLAFTPFHGQRVIDESLSYRVTLSQPLPSGDINQAFKVTFQR